jgi:hypothetical protein
MKHKFDIRETVARAFPGADRAQADRFLRWLDYNGYTIVERETDEATSVPGSAPQDKLVTER